MSEIYLVAMFGFAIAGIFLFVVVCLLEFSAIREELKDLSSKIEEFNSAYGETPRNIELIKFSLSELERKMLIKSSADGAGTPNGGKQK